jgi:hypothetical protein
VAERRPAETWGPGGLTGPAGGQPAPDMSAAAVTARLRVMAELLAHRGFVTKGVDMSPAAVTARLRVMGSLADMCRRLAEVGPRLRRG